MDEESDEFCPANSDSSQRLEDESAAHATVEKLVCDRCRRRKIRCGRVHPCSQCVKASVPCSYPIIQRPRDRRQRILVSAVFENKMDLIAKRVEDMSQIMQRLDSMQLNLVSPASSSHCIPSYTLQSSAPSRSTPAPSVSTLNDASQGRHTPRQQDAGPEYEDQSSLLAHATFATGFLQTEVNNRSTDVFLEMTSALDTLRNIIEAQKKGSDSVETLYPYAKPPVSDPDIHHLPLPPIGKAFAGLRMAKEFPQIRTYWCMEFPTLGHFMEYLLRVYSPGAASEADLIIVHTGLYWLFCACSNTCVDETDKLDYDSQACLCRDNLETVLSRLSFHVPTTMDYACAMSMAASYLIQRRQSSAAWNFVTTASRICQALGVYNAIPPLNNSVPEQKTYQARVFWCIFLSEKMLSLRLGRTSTIRDEDITLPLLGPDQNTDTILSSILPCWIHLASLQGRVYDEIYSSRALLKPENVRHCRAQILAAELKELMNTNNEFEIKFFAENRRVLGPAVHDLMRGMDKVMCLSLLTLIYRSIPCDKASRSPFCKDCITTAKAALAEHEKCMLLMTKHQLQSTVIGMYYMNWSLMQSPFVPFIVLFCEIAETSKPSDLGCLRALIETLESFSKSTHYPICEKQFRLFKSMYDVAAKFVDVRVSRAESSVPEYPDISDSHEHDTLAESLSATKPASTGPLCFLPISLSSTLDGESQHAPAFSGLTNFEENMALQTQASTFGDNRFEMDPSSAELGNWFCRNQEMLMMLEDL